MSKAHQNNPNNRNSFGSAEPKQSEIAKEKVLDTGKNLKLINSINQFTRTMKLQN